MEANRVIDDIIHILAFTGRTFAILTIVSFPFAVRGSLSWNTMFYMAVITGTIVILTSIIGIVNTVFVLVKKLIQVITKRQDAIILPLPGDVAMTVSADVIAE